MQAPLQLKASAGRGALFFDCCIATFKWLHKLSQSVCTFSFNVMYGLAKVANVERSRFEEGIWEEQLFLATGWQPAMLSLQDKGSNHSLV